LATGLSTRFATNARTRLLIDALLAERVRRLRALDHDQALDRDRALRLAA
jgi:hypothetical protein